ncbi:NACHT domain-containing protein [Lysinibacillus sp. NPDC048646]|uniref:NACHT domain-containing protein n=1 Tax=Lysinibacillus sp. NPDC048646 TaxID=3390574 RepID=UPI003D02554C
MAYNENYHEWKRYWYKRGQELSYKDGFFEPENISMLSEKFSIVPIQEILSNPCLVLLGEAGLGKSTIIKQTVTELKETQGESIQEILYCDLRLISSAESLYKSIFENKIFVDWISSNHKLYIFLDSFDEGLLQVGVLADLLADKLKNYDISRLMLRVACRTGIFPSTFEQDLCELWGRENVGVFQLAPLSSANIITACDNYGINGKDFLKDVIDLQIQAFSSNPVTLEMLLKRYRRNKQLLKSKIELYEEGCRTLCSETNEKRKINNNTCGIVPVDKRLEIAMLLAAVTIFCNKSTINKGILEDGKILIDELVSIAYQKYAYTNQEVEEVLGTALFTERNQNEYGWAHLSYAEYLAARFLYKKEFSDEQILSLILQSEDDNRRIIPQLHQTTAWIASYRSDIFEIVSNKDPDVLCLSDMEELNGEQKELLVDNLLKKCDENYMYHRYGNASFYKNLNHANLAKQLQKFLKNESRTEHVQKTVLHIVYFCNLKEFTKDLLKLIEYNRYNYLSYKALHVFFSLANEEQKKLSLRMLGEISNECDILICKELYPKHVDVEKILELLQKKLFSDSDIKREITSLIKPLSKEDLNIILLKLHEITMNNELKTMDEILDIVLIYSYDYWDYKKLQESWISIANERFNRLGTPILKTSYINDFQGGFHERFRSDFNKRLLLIKYIWRNKTSIGIVELIRSKLELVNEGDLEYLVSAVVEEQEESFQKLLVNLVTHFFDPNNPKSIKVCEPLYKFQCLKKLLYVVPLSSLEANTLKKIYKESIQETKKVNFRRPSRNQLIKNLSKFDENPIGNWVNFVKPMYSRFQSFSLDERSLSNSYGWELLNEEEHQIIVEAAKNFLLMFQIKKKELAKDNIEINVYPVLEAIQLIWEYEQEFIKSWSLEMYEYITDPGTDSYINGKDFFKIAYIHAPKKTSNLLLKVLSEPRSPGSWHGGRDIAERRILFCADDFLVNEIIETLKKPNIRLTSRGDLYKLLIIIGGKRALEYVENLVKSRHASLTNYKRGIEAACSLMEKDINGGTSLISPLLTSSNDQEKRFFILTIKHYVKDRRSYSFLNTWKYEELKNLYIFLHENKKRIKNNYLFKIEDWKNEILEKFKGKENSLGLTYLFELNKALPDCKYVQLYWERVRTTYFRDVWVPPTMGVLFKMIENTNIEPISNGKQLVSTIYKSLSHFEKEINASENPLVEQFWNVINEIYLPKNETMLSNILKTHLSYDLEKKGIVFNREVEVFHKQGGIPGERIDIKVDVPIDSNRRETLKAYIEVKGCWNQGLKTDMEGQLIKRYMLNRQCTNGLYVIGWFNCPQWTLPEDSRKPPNYSLEEAKEKFSEQAESLSRKYNVDVKALVLDLSLK